MQQRIDVTKVSPAAYQAFAALQSYVDKSGLDAKLRELIKIRVSQINGCAYCLAMHTRDARKFGETDERMHLLNAWREAPLYSARDAPPWAGSRPLRWWRKATYPMTFLKPRVRDSPKRRSLTSLLPRLLSIAGTGSRSRFACRRRSKARKRPPRPDLLARFCEGKPLLDIPSKCQASSEVST